MPRTRTPLKGKTNMPNQSASPGSEFHWPFMSAWASWVVFYFLQYALRSAPGVMVPELTATFGLSALGVSSLIGLYYYTYSTFSILSGASLDRYGAKFAVPVGIGLVAIGATLFGLGDAGAADAGRLFQGAGSAFAF